jgi:hypothetical protein
MLRIKILLKNNILFLRTTLLKHRVDRVLSFFSSRWIWDSSPLTPLVSGGGAQEREEGGHN